MIPPADTDCVLETSRLRLAPMLVADAAELFDLLSTPTSMCSPATVRPPG